MKNLFLYTKRVLISGVIAFLVLTLFCFFYFNVPIHYTCADGATDYVWEAHKFYSRATEGIGYGKTNNEGYMNAYDYDAEKGIDVLVMGSSHIEDQFIPLNDNMCTILNNKLVNMSVYNIGMSGHSFKVCINNLDNALLKYKPEYVVIETSNLAFSDQYIENIINGDVDEKESNSNGIIVMLQKNPLFRLLYTQMQSFITESEQTIDETNQATVFELNEELTDDLIKYIKNICDKYGTKVIILYHPPISFDEDGKMLIQTQELSDIFSKICMLNEVYYIDMSEKFLTEYDNSYTVPKGFINTSIGYGHLNSGGHRMIADELKRFFMEGIK